MSILKKVSPEWALRIGFAAMYLYSGFDIYNHPGSWTWAVPSWFVSIVTSLGLSIELYLKIQAVGEIIFALAFLAWFLKPTILEVITVLATLEMAGILFLGKTGIDAITFRDLGLLGGLLALAILFDRKRLTEKTSARLNI